MKKWMIFLFALASSAFAQSGLPELHVARIIALDYPWLPRTAMVEGPVELLATISPEGNVTEVLSQSGHPLLAKPAKETIAKWLFSGSPRPEGCKLKIHIKFALRGSCLLSQQCPTEFVMDALDQISVSAAAIHGIGWP